MQLNWSDCGGGASLYRSELTIVMYHLVQEAPPPLPPGNPCLAHTCAAE